MNKKPKSKYINNIRSKHKISSKDTVANYQSAELFLNVAQKEYDKEDGRAKNIDNRAGILISALVLLFTFYLPQMKLSEIISLIDIDVIDIIPQIIILLLYTLAIITFTCSLFSLLSAIAVKTNSRLSYDDLANQDLHRASLDIVASSLAIKYCDLAKKNEISNNKKVDYYSKGLKYLVTTVLLMTVSIILSMVFCL